MGPVETPDYIVDLSGGGGPRQPPAHGGSAGGAAAPARPWLAVHWKCCGVYSRVYRNAEGTAYESRCPRCARPLRIAVGPGGTTSRFFEAT